MIDRLELAGVAVQRGGRRLFEGLSLVLAPGEACALTGANGAGKTTLLRAVAGLAPLEAGRIAFGRMDPSEARAGGLHLVGHQDGLKPARTTAEELQFWSRWGGGTGAATDAAVEALGLSALLGLEVRRLSAGQRRRLALARLVAAPRRLWLLDEPLSPLDAGWRTRFGEMMAAHLAGGGLILAAVHDPLPIPAKVLEIAS
ncbi:MAG: heme ABC exporter ATP-binding protein CcmA [Phenylobacterium sp.]